MRLKANLILIGPMGAGKSTIGRRLAHSLSRDFIDSDSEIEKRTGVSIPLIFEMEGEAGFRLREKNIIAELVQRNNIVLATGGGAAMERDTQRNLSATGFVIYLYTSVDEQLRRIGHDSNRPMLQADDPRKRLDDLLALRDPVYRSVADLVIDTDGCRPKRVAQQILHYLEQEQV